MNSNTMDRIMMNAHEQYRPIVSKTFWKLGRVIVDLDVQTISLHNTRMKYMRAKVDRDPEEKRLGQEMIDICEKRNKLCTRFRYVYERAPA